MRLLKYTFLISAAIFILLQLLYYSQLPDNIAIHFNAVGEVDGWMPKSLNLMLSCLIIFIVTLSFGGIPYILKNISPDMINVPKKEYWLNGNNKDRLVTILSSHLYFIGLTTNLFLVVLFHQLYEFNIRAIDKVSVVIMIPYGVFLLGLMVHLFIRLNKCT
jgi:uncharacterized membrane protein